jgi:hypothetical protein
MLEDKTMVRVTNRDNGRVGYVIPDLGNLHRVFESGESKDVSMQELRKLSWLPGGKDILENYLVLDNKDAISELLGEVEPEYHYTEDDVKVLLLTGSLDALKDCLDFAPEGTINLVKKLAVELEINDILKRQAILEKTGFNVNTAIMVNHETSEEGDSEEKTRRVAVNTPGETTSTGRRTVVQPTSKYKVTSIK